MLRPVMAASAAFVGMFFLAAPSYALQTIHLPDPNAQAQGDGPPDGLFDKSVPDTWQKKSTDSSSNKPALGGFHFSVTGASGYSSNGFGTSGSLSGTFGTSQSPDAYSAARVPGSEFYQPLPGYQDPYFAH